jgi:hypothetical protein
MTSKATRLADGVFLSAHSGGRKTFMTTRYYIYDRAHHVSEVDRLKWTRWVEKGNSASKHNWVGMAQVVTTFLGSGKRDWAGMAQALATLGPTRYIWKPGLSVCFVVDLYDVDVQDPQICAGGLEQGETMHAKMLASARRRFKEREKTGQEAKKSIFEEWLAEAERDARICSHGYRHSRRPLCHAALTKTYIGGEASRRKRYGC